MNAMDEALMAFGLGMNLNLRFNDRGVCALAMDDDCNLIFERAGDTLLVAISRTIPQYDRERAQLALKQCHFSQGAEANISAGMEGDATLYFFQHLEADAFTRPALETSVNMLLRLHETSMEAV